CYHVLRATCLRRENWRGWARRGGRTRPRPGTRSIIRVAERLTQRASSEYVCCTDKRQATPNPQTQETRLNRASLCHRHNQSRCQFLLIARKHIKLQTRCGIRTLQL